MLTLQQIRTKPADRLIKLSDGEGLQLHITPAGARYWRLAYREDGRQRMQTLGQFPTMTPAEARKEAAAMKQVARGGAVGRDTIKDVIPLFMRHLRHDGRSDATMKCYEAAASAIIQGLGNEDMASVRTRDLVDFLLNEFDRSAARAERLRGFLSGLFRYAVARGLIEQSPAENLGAALPRVRSENYRTLNHDLVGPALRRIDGMRGSHGVRAALRLAPLVLLRSSELRALHVDHFDEDRRVLLLPADLMKGGRADHIVPLSRQAFDIVAGASKRACGGLLFSARGGEPLGPNSLCAALSRAGIDSTLHGFRHLGSTLLHEAFPERSLAIEAQLSHVDKNRIRATYNRASYLDIRFELMQWLSDRYDTLKAS